MNYPRISLRSGREHVVKGNHPWIFSQALSEQIPNLPHNGAIVDIYGSDGKYFIARGYYNSNSQIVVRILTRDRTQDIDVTFFEEKFRDLEAVRKRFIDTRSTNAYRLVFGESDGMPGLIVDRYNETYVIQIHTLGMDLLKPLVVEALKRVCSPKTIYERSDVGVRTHEGLSDQPTGTLFGAEPKNEIEILENGVKFLVNVRDGQKTGMFLDQRENRKALQKYVDGARVLNCFSYTAGFSLYAALAGAIKTVSVDVSGDALATARRNFEANGLPTKHHEFVDEDVFDYLDGCIQKKMQFDVIILDPPAFVKNQKNLTKGLSGYLFINEKALRILPKGGILVSSSCSAHVTDEMFVKMLTLAASRTNCGLKVLEIRHQPPDHPFSLQFPEGKYLKYYVLLKTSL